MKDNSTIHISYIKTRNEFKNLFKIHPDVISRIYKDMLQKGYDPSFPVMIAEVPEVDMFLLDGHMRLEAAGKACISEIPYEIKPFHSLEEALDYAIHVQRDRRNISDAELFEQTLLVDKRKRKGEKSTDYKGKSAGRTAHILGTSTRKIEQIRTVQKKASDKDIEDIKTGKNTINGVYRNVRENRKRSAGTGHPAGNFCTESSNMAVNVMMITAKYCPEVEEITDKASGKWERALMRFFDEKLEKLGVAE